MRVKYRSDGRLPPGEGECFPAVQVCSRLSGAIPEQHHPHIHPNLLQIPIGGFFMSKKIHLATRVLTHCAILIALGVVIARVFSLAPNEFSRFSIESIPIFLSGMLFGPAAGAMVGFATDFIGCLFSPWGFNPLLCLPPILYGISGGIFRHFLAAKPALWRFALSLLPAAALGSVLWQSFALDFVYGSGFLVLLGSRSIQFAVVLVIDTVILRLLPRV